MTQNNKKLNVVIDTNIILASVSRKSKYNLVFQKILNKEINLFITNDIILEYEEILEKNFSSQLARNVIELFLIAENIHKIIPYYHWQLIEKDKDDNKFVDCTVAANADYLVTNDKHFDILKNIDFPKIKVINIDDFMKILQS